MEKRSKVGDVQIVVEFWVDDDAISDVFFRCTDLKRLNGTPMVDVQDTQFARGPIALQRTAGIVKFRSVRVRTL